MSTSASIKVGGGMSAEDRALLVNLQGDVLLLRVVAQHLLAQHPSEHALQAFNARIEQVRDNLGDGPFRVAFENAINKLNV